MFMCFVMHYVKVFSHDTTGGLFINEDALSKYPSFPDVKLYSILWFLSF